MATEPGIAHHPLVRGYTLLAAAAVLILAMLALEHTYLIERLFASSLGGGIYLVLVSGLMLGALGFFTVAIWRGPGWPRVLAVPAAVVIVVYHLVLLHGP